jgi:hypothetical protein
MNIKQAFQAAVKDRTFVVVAIIMIVLALILVISAALNIRPNELQVPVRFSSFSVTRYFTDKWYYLISFVVMGLAMAILHVLIALKVYAQKGRELALLFMWLGVSIIIIAAVTIFALFRVVLFTQ